ncbi:MAG: NADH-quinone oxidoreductase subunit M, partial [Leptonema sp. (in: Bacteria)]|nr:NADH-quinone oxidoreductase subunit M [Leptonema sp. (in: bacteria)]
MLSSLIFIPLVGVVIIPFLRGYKAPAIAAFVVSLVAMIVSFQLLFSFDASADGFQFVENLPLLPDFAISYKLGLDGISYWMILLTTCLFPIVILASYSSITDRASGYFISLLILETGVIGAFVALDLVLFYIFWEIMLIPMFFIIGIWGGKDRVYATVKFVLFTMFGSLLMLVALIYVAYYAGGFDYELILTKHLPVSVQYWAFIAFGLAFIIKVPVFPFHTWLPDAHTEAPAGGSVILASLLLKLGIYGLLRFNLPLFPDAAEGLAPLMIILGVIGIIHGAMAAAVQPDMKRLIAYSSVSHMGFIILGLFTFTVSGIQGAMIQMVNHGISTGALFLLIGMIYDQTHTRKLSDYGGLAKVSPVFATVFLISVLASVGLPGLNGFIGEYVILISAFQVDWLLGSLAVIGVILAAWYLLRLYNGIFFGPLKNSALEKVRDLNLREMVVLSPLVFFMFYIGVYPKPFFDAMSTSIQTNVLDMMVSDLDDETELFIPNGVINVESPLVETEKST